MSMLSDIKSLLAGIESTIYLADMPDTPDKLICIYNSGGRDPIHNLAKDRITQPTIQIRARDTSYDSGLARCEAINAILDVVSNQTINNTFYVSIKQQSDILPLGKDEKKRSEFAINYVLQIKK